MKGSRLASLKFIARVVGNLGRTWALTARIFLDIGASGAALCSETDFGRLEPAWPGLSRPARDPKIGFAANSLAESPTSRQTPNRESPFHAQIGDDIRSGLRAGGAVPLGGTLWSRPRRRIQDGPCGTDLARALTAGGGVALCERRRRTIQGLAADDPGASGWRRHCGAWQRSPSCPIRHRVGPKIARAGRTASSIVIFGRRCVVLSSGLPSL